MRRFAQTARDATEGRVFRRSPFPTSVRARVTVPAAYAVRSLPDNVERGYIQSWNFSIQKQFWGGLIAQAAYVGSRQVKITQRFDLNAGQVLGAGTAGQPYFTKFGRTTATELLTPIGHNKYDSLQTSLQRRLLEGLRVNWSYTFSKSDRHLLRRSERRPAADPDPAVLQPEPRADAVTTARTISNSLVAELPSGKASAGRPTVWIGCGGWQFNGLISAYSGTPFSVVDREQSVECAGEHASARTW